MKKEEEEKRERVRRGEGSKGRKEGKKEGREGRKEERTSFFHGIHMALH